MNLQQEFIKNFLLLIWVDYHCSYGCCLHNSKINSSREDNSVWLDGIRIRRFRQIKRIFSARLNLYRKSWI